MLPIAFDSAVIGTATEAGSGLDAGADAGAEGVGAGDPVVCVTAAAAALCTACTVVCKFVGDDAAPADVTPAHIPAARISPHIAVPMEISRFRLKVLLLLCWGHTPALKPAPSLIPLETWISLRSWECGQQL